MSQEEHRLPLRGEKVGDYEILGALGQGAHGVVFKAESAGKLYALKFFHEHVQEERSLREVALMASVSHPHLVRFLGAGRWRDVARGRPYIAMEYVAGQPLHKWLEAAKPTPRELVCHLVLPLARALAELHRAGLVHRDIKLSNILPG